MKKLKQVILVMLCVSVFSVFALGSGSEESTTATKVGEVSSTNSATPTKASESAPTESESTSSSVKEETKTEYFVGDTLSVKGLNITFTNSSNYVSDNDFIQPTDGNKFIRLAFHVDNQSGSDKSVSVFEFTCYADGYVCQTSYQGDDLSASLSNGRSTDGAVYFEVPVDAKEIEVEYELDLISGKKVKFVFEGDNDSGLVFENNTTVSENAFHVGDIIETKKLRISYIKADEYVSDNMFLQPSEGMKYAYIELEVENLSDSDQTISYFSFKCYADGAACAGCYYMDDALSATLSPGRKAKGTVAFEVPIDAQVIEIEFEDNFWTESKIIFSYE